MAIAGNLPGNVEIFVVHFLKILWKLNDKYENWHLMGWISEYEHIEHYSTSIEEDLTMQRMSPNEIDFEDLNKFSTKISSNEEFRIDFE